MEWTNRRELMKSSGNLPFYQVPRVNPQKPPKVNGRVDDTSWAHAPWTDAFGDILGLHGCIPHLQTRAKMLWDDEGLWVGAKLEEPRLYALQTEKNAHLWEYDNNFELFIDIAGSFHNYYEFQVNAINTIVELHLTKPRRDGGEGRVGANLEGLRSAVHVAKMGQPDFGCSAPTDSPEFNPAQFWSVTVHVPFESLGQLLNSGASVQPRTNDVWRFTMSRVEWETEEIDASSVRRVEGKDKEGDESNWTWSPQGAVDMHSPERWGFIKFVDSLQEAGTPSLIEVDPLLPFKEFLVDAYYRNMDYYAVHSKHAMTLEELKLTAPEGCKATVQGGLGFRASVEVQKDKKLLQLAINHERKLEVMPV